VAVQALAPEEFAQWRDEALLVVGRAAKLAGNELRLLAVKQGSVVLVLAVPEREQGQVLAADPKDLARLCALTPGDGACDVTVRAAEPMEPFPLVLVAGAGAALAVLALAVGLKRRAAKRSVLPAEGAQGSEQTAGAGTAKVELGVQAGGKALEASVATPSTAAPEDVADLAAVPGDPVVEA